MFKGRKLRVMTLEEIREESIWYDGDDSVGVMALVDVFDMGWCKDGVTRWYIFEDENGNPAIYYRH